MTRFRDIRAKDKKTKQERVLDMIEKLIQNYEDNVAGPYWVNREQIREMKKNIRKSETIERHKKLNVNAKLMRN